MAASSPTPSRTTAPVRNTTAFKGLRRNRSDNSLNQIVFAGHLLFRRTVAAIPRIRISFLIDKRRSNYRAAQV